jgi:hypothetical protein
MDKPFERTAPKKKIKNVQPSCIREVWAYNFEEEMMKMMNLVEKTKYVAMVN